MIGGAFALIGSWGLVRLPSLMERLHGPTKATSISRQTISMPPR
jgi:multicomponent K+:H+ antiporter subunit G